MSIDVDFTYIVVLVLFLVPLLILNGIVFKPFMKLFAERHEKLEGALERAEGMIGQAEEKAKAFEEKVKVATARGIEARNSIRAEAAAQMNGRLDQERVVLAKKLENALHDLEKSRRQAVADVHVEAERMAEMTAQKLLGRSL